MCTEYVFAFVSLGNHANRVLFRWIKAARTTFCHFIVDWIFLSDAFPIIFPSKSNKQHKIRIDIEQFAALCFWILAPGE